MNDTSAHLHSVGTGGELPPVWGDADLEIHTVGIDVGTTTSHVVLGKLVLEPETSGRRHGYRVRAREVLRASEPILTPYQAAALIDERAIAAFVRQEIELGGLLGHALDVGALILTGYASLTTNADAVSHALAEVVGELVTVAAGDKLEAVLSAHGAGSVAYSVANPEADVLHVDIGGGTTKIVAMKAGNIDQVGALDGGARLVAWNEQQVISVNEHSLRKLDVVDGVAVGSPIADDVKSRLASRVADVIGAVIDGRDADVPNSLWLTPRVHVRHRPTVLFSGGVAEYIYGRSTHDHGDMGLRIAQRLQHYRTESTGGGIRATVIGLAQYTTQVSGATVYVSNPDGLPARNLVVVHVGHHAGSLPSRASVADLISTALAAMEFGDRSDRVLLTFAEQFDADYPTIAAVCGGIADALPDSRTGGRTLYVSFGQDVALTAGSILHDEIDWPGDLVVVDGVEFQSFDRVDVGTPADGGLVPVTVKRMVFSDASRGEAPTSQISVVRD
jgi:ethanolamine utilization protein EutA